MRVAENTVSIIENAFHKLSCGANVCVCLRIYAFLKCQLYAHP